MVGSGEAGASTSTAWIRIRDYEDKIFDKDYIEVQI